MGFNAFTTVFQLYLGGQCTYPIPIPGVLSSSTPHNIFASHCLLESSKNMTCTDKKDFHRTTAVVSAILETMSRGTSNSKVVRNIDESDACIKSEQNLLTINKVNVCKRNGRTDKEKTMGLPPTRVGGTLIQGDV